MSSPPVPRRRKKIVWTPYLLILPSFVYLLLFFAYPMVRGLTLAVWENNAQLALREEADRGSAVSANIPRGTVVQIVDQQGNTIPPEELTQPGLITETWFQVRGQDAGGQEIEGWAPESRIRVRERDDSGRPTVGSIRPRIGSGASETTNIHAEPNESSDIVGALEERAEVEILDQAVLELWYRISGEIDGETIEGWAQSRYFQVFSDSSQARINQGNVGVFTTRYIERMVNDRFFMPALRTTLLLMVLIIPAQFILAIIMALVIQANLRGSSFFLYVFSIALGVSDLAVGILWYSIFTQTGFLNSILQGLGLIDAPVTYLSAQTIHWIIIAIWLAEVWRATSLVMVIIISGMQAISTEVLEAAEIYGATLWQRVWHVILPLLKPSLQVALILRTILALQVFAVVIALSGGDIVTVLANETYRQYYDLRNLNVAAAYASFILLLSMISAVFYLRAVRTHEEVAA